MTAEKPSRKPSPANIVVTLFLCGDVMTGRGIDQVLPNPSDPVLHEPYVKDARRYVEIAEQANGAIPKQVGFSYVWGDALYELDRMKPDLRIINLETAITQSKDYWKAKGIHYRMHPKNVPCLTAAGIDCCSLANNHVLDWGYSGLADTLNTLNQAGIRTTGAGATLHESGTPAVLDVEGKGRVLVFSFGSPSSGIPFNWAAEKVQPGVSLLWDFADETVDRIKKQIQEVKRPRDIVVASIHWGANWGYEIPSGQRNFAHSLIDRAGVEIIHGHSSHHVKSVEVYKSRPIIYGCGDFLNDYEGIGGYEEFRADLALLYFVSIDPTTGDLLDVHMIPMQIRKFRENQASTSDLLWLKSTLDREGKALGTHVELTGDGGLALQWE